MSTTKQELLVSAGVHKLVERQTGVSSSMNSLVAGAVAGLSLGSLQQTRIAMVRGSIVGALAAGTMHSVIEWAPTTTLPSTLGSTAWTIWKNIPLTLPIRRMTEEEVQEHQRRKQLQIIAEKRSRDSHQD